MSTPTFRDAIEALIDILKERSDCEFGIPLCHTFISASIIEIAERVKCSSQVMEGVIRSLNALDFLCLLRSDGGKVTYSVRNPAFVAEYDLLNTSC